MSRINLTDSDDAIAQKIRKAKTDPEPLPDDPAAARRAARGAATSSASTRAVTGESVEQVLARFAGQGFGAFKPALADALIALARAAPRRGSRSSATTRPSSTGSSPPAPSGPRELAAPTLGRGLSRGRPDALIATLHRQFSRLSWYKRPDYPRIFPSRGRVIMRIHKLAPARCSGRCRARPVRLRDRPPRPRSRAIQAMPAPPGQSFYVVPANGAVPAGSNSLAMPSLVAQAMLRRRAIARQARRRRRDMLVQLDYGVDEGTTEIVAIRSPLLLSAASMAALLRRLRLLRPALLFALRLLGRRSPFYYGWDDPFWYGSPYGRPR